ncbi:MAG: hypothetical protein Q4G68_09300 [Planctomycetia bacterium]|nr:hypothetical protein [Planctomycetia bacterium]
MRIILFLTMFFTAILPALGQEEYQPTAVVYCSGEHFSYKEKSFAKSDNAYCTNNVIDGNPDTYGCILDDTPTGNDAKTYPPRGKAPVTGYVIFDFGETRTLYGLKLMAPKKNRYVPKTVDVVLLEETCDSSLFSQYNALVADSRAHTVVCNADFPYFCDGETSTMVFEPTSARYLVLKVHSAWDSGRDRFFVYQFAEIFGLGTSEPPDTIDINSIIVHNETLGDALAELKQTNQEVSRRNIDPCTPSRLRQEWIRQDCNGKSANCFVSDSDNEIEKQLFGNVLEELKEYGLPTSGFEAQAKILVNENVVGRDTRWASLYWAMCKMRRIERLKHISDFNQYFVYAKHYVIGGRIGALQMTADLTDTEIENHGPDWRVGSELMLLSISSDGAISQEVLLQADKGIIRDPSVSFDGDKIAFAMKTDEHDDYHLYVMDVATRQYEQITFGTATADYEPCFLQSGDLIFSSTRCDQSAPCWWSNVSNLYTCDVKGRFLRRLGFDTSHVFSPQVLDNGQVVFCRWEYNDRGPIFNQPLMVMNPDGTTQTEYYGNNSWSPTSIIHARGVPGTSKIIAIESGHHSDQAGKMILIDRTQGTQAGKGLQYAAPTRPYVWEIDDRSGCHGELYQYPYSLDEDNYLVSYLPEGNPDVNDGGRGMRYDIPFGIYWMDSEGRRELLVYDPTISSGQIVPLAQREKAIVKSSTLDLDKEDGTFFVQNVYLGPGLEGVPKGTVKKLRVVALEFRAMGTCIGYNKYYGPVTTPVSVFNGSWDVKHVLGTVDVEDDGSAYFKVPARTPVYFQMLDEKGYVVQTMRSWAMVLPGENFGCVGCHEDKNTNYFTPDQKLSIAAAKPAQDLVPFYRDGEEPIPERLSNMTESERKAWKYLSVNAPQGTDRPRGFSYLREIQPILDQHCVCCHDGRTTMKDNTIPMSLLGNARTYSRHDVWKSEYTIPSYTNKQYLHCQGGGGMNPGRDFAESYLNLTHLGKDSNLVDAFLATSDPVMLQPRSYGSSRSKLMQFLEPDHYDVKLSQNEKDIIACWIDLCVPFCGSYMEANHWDRITGVIMSKHTTELRGVYLYHEQKRLKHAEIEVAHLEKYKEYLKTGREFEIGEFPVFTFGGVDKEDAFIAATHEQANQAPIFGAGEATDARGGSNITGNARRNLALNPQATTFSVTSYPHATSNSHWKYWDTTSPRLTIDGKRESSDNAWRPNRRTDLWLKVEFGRSVSVDEVVLTLKLTEEQKKTWSKAVIRFSDESEIPIELACTTEPQHFPFTAKATTSVTITNLQEDSPLSDNGVVELEVWGQDQ